MSWLRNRNILVVTVGFFFLFAGFGGIGRNLIALLKRDNLEWWGNLSNFCVYGMFFIGNLYWFPMLKRLGLKTALIAGAVPYVIYDIGATTGDPIILIMCGVLVGFSASLLWNSSTEIMRQSCSEKEFGTLIGLKHTAVLTGSAIAVFSGSPFIEHTSRALLFSVYAGVSAIGLILLTFVRIDTSNNQIQIHSKDYSGSMRFWLIAPMCIVSSFAAVVGNSSLASIVVSRYGEATSSMISGIVVASAAFSGVLSGKLSDRLGGLTVAFALAVGVILAVLGIMSENYTCLLLSIVPLGFGGAGMTPSLLQAFRLRLKPNENMSANAAIFVFGTLGTTLGYTATLCVEPQTVLWITIGVVAVALLLLLRFSRRFPEVKNNV